MVAVLERGPGRKRIASTILLTIGGLALFLQLGALWLEAAAAWRHSAADCVGWLGALGLAVLQIADFIAWNPNGILLSVTRLLLLCWPVAVMMTGVVLSSKGH